MKRQIINLFSITLLLLVAITACKSPVDGVNIDKELLLAVGQTKTLTPTFVPPDANNQNVAWESSDLKVATVDNGKITGKTVGKAIITVKTQDGGRTAKCYVTVVQPIEPTMVLVEGGTFTMGCTDDECFDNENPSHQVMLNSFYMGKYEVTQKEWVAIMDNNPSFFKGDNLPVEQVSWNDVQTYIKKLNELTKKNYRLPTEAEWEYAARGGKKSEGFKYSGSDDVHAVAWHGKSATQQAGALAPNELGIYDLSGNVWEFCSDWLGGYTDGTQTNPLGPESGTLRVVRGGSWGNGSPAACRVARRDGSPPTFRHHTAGFRLVL